MPDDQATACGARECGTADDGCDGTVSCGTCNANETCNASQQCECVPLDAMTACGTQTCGTAGDGCGGMVSCGAPCPMPDAGP
jgi:hypothetical protein